MTSTEILELANQVIENDPLKAGPLVRVLYAFKEAKAGAEGEMMMNEVIDSIYLKTSHYQDSLKKFLSIAA